MVGSSLAQPRYALLCVHPDGKEDLVSEHPDFASGWNMGTHTATVLDKGGAYSLYFNGVVSRSSSTSVAVAQ